jgi:hypothetical protein
LVTTAAEKRLTVPRNSRYVLYGSSVALCSPCALDGGFAVQCHKLAMRALAAERGGAQVVIQLADFIERATQL